jgi:hypothetical protein
MSYAARCVARLAVNNESFMSHQTNRTQKTRARASFWFLQGRAIVGLTMGLNGEYSPTKCERGPTAQNRM